MLDARVAILIEGVMLSRDLLQASIFLSYPPEAECKVTV